MRPLFDIPQPMLVPVAGEEGGYLVGRIFCVGRNYVAHAQEMGGEVDREAPWYFCKTPTAATPSGATVPYPPGTGNFHHEMELGLAIGAPAFRVSVEDAPQSIYGYYCSLDMTRRDRQQDGKDHRRPWDLGKDIEHGAIIAPMTRATAFTPANQRIHLSVNGTVRQDSTLADMVWSCAEIVSHLSHYYHLRPGDLILTGTPAGVGPVDAGDVIEGGIDGLDPVSLTLGPAE